MPASDGGGDRRFWLQIAAIAVAALVAVLVIFSVARVQYSYADHFTAAGFSAAGTTLHTPQGAAVSGSWAAVGGSVSFQVLDASGDLVYFSQGSSGSYSFVASDPPYGLEALSTTTATVYVWGSYSAPVL